MGSGKYYFKLEELYYILVSLFTYYDLNKSIIWRVIEKLVKSVLGIWAISLYGSYKLMWCKNLVIAMDGRVAIICYYPVGLAREGLSYYLIYVGFCGFLVTDCKHYDKSDVSRVKHRRLIRDNKCLED